MDIKRCENGHFFDVDTYAMCPHCGAGVAAGKTSGISVKAESAHGWFSKKKEKSRHKTVEPQATESIFGSESGMNHVELSESQINKSVTDNVSAKNTEQGIFDDRVFESEESGDSDVNRLDEQNVTIDIWDSSNASDVSSSREVLNDQSNKDEPEVSNATERDGYRTEMASDDNYTSAREAVVRASAAEEGKTLSFFSLNRPSASEPQRSQTEGTSSGLESIPEVSEPPVGWMICIKGGNFGRCYSIFSGRNSVGRNRSNKIVITGDSHISREKHAWISYEPRGRKFNIQPGDGSGLTYLNGEVVMLPVEMKKGDRIELGESEFMFIPLCDDSFSWEDYM